MLLSFAAAFPSSLGHAIAAVQEECSKLLKYIGVVSALSKMWAMSTLPDGSGHVNWHIS